MKRLLPKASGFTLVELLVVIAIIAILAVVGITVFSGVQKNARDAKRKADIDAIANAIEMKRTSGTSYYDQNISATDFAGGVIPVESYTGGSWAPKYSIAFYCNALNTAVVAPGKPTDWTSTALPTLPTGYLEIKDAFPPPVGLGANACATKVWAWKVCARLESGSGVPVYCKSNSQ